MQTNETKKGPNKQKTHSNEKKRSERRKHCAPAGCSKVRTPPSRHKHTHRPDRLQYTAPQLASAQCKNPVLRERTVRGWFSHLLRHPAMKRVYSVNPGAHTGQSTPTMNKELTLDALLFADGQGEAVLLVAFELQLFDFTGVTPAVFLARLLFRFKPFLLPCVSNKHNIALEIVSANQTCQSCDFIATNIKHSQGFSPVHICRLCRPTLQSDR